MEDKQIVWCSGIWKFWSEGFMRLNFTVTYGLINSHKSVFVNSSGDAPRNVFPNICNYPIGNSSFIVPYFCLNIFPWYEIDKK